MALPAMLQRQSEFEELVSQWSRVFESTALMMLATAASETSAKNGNRPQSNRLEKVI